MRTFLAAATGLPTILLTTALVVVVCFWLLAAVGVADADSFDRGVDLRAWRMSGVPVTVAFSLLTVLAWSLSVGAVVLLAVFVRTGLVAGVLRLVVPVGALIVAWAATCLIRPSPPGCQPPPTMATPGQHGGDGGQHQRDGEDVGEPGQDRLEGVGGERDAADGLPGASLGPTCRPGSAGGPCDRFVIRRRRTAGPLRRPARPGDQLHPQTVT